MAGVQLDGNLILSLLFTIGSLLKMTEAQVTSCANAERRDGMMHCISWEEKDSTCIPIFQSNFGIDERNGYMMLNTPNYPSFYPSGTACTWSVVNSDTQCTELLYLLVDKDFQQNAAQQSCSVKDHIEINGQRFCGPNACGSSSECLFQRFRGRNLVLRFASDASGTSSGASVMVFRTAVSSQACNRRRKRTNKDECDFRFFHVPKSYYCRHYYPYPLEYYKRYYHYYIYSQPLCTCFGTCNVTENKIRETLLAIIRDASGQAALLYINSPSDQLRETSRTVTANLQNFNRTVLTRENFSSSQCSGTASPPALRFPTPPRPTPAPTTRPPTTRPPTTRPPMTRPPTTRPPMTRPPTTRPTPPWTTGTPPTTKGTYYTWPTTKGYPGTTRQPTGGFYPHMSTDPNHPIRRPSPHYGYTRG